MSTSMRKRQAALICISGRSIGQMFLLVRDHITVGRAPECDIFLDDEGVSRQHAAVVLRGGAWLVVDVGSTNGTFHDGDRIDALMLTDGTQIHLGAGTILQFRYQDEREVEFHALMQTYKTQDPLTDALNRRAFVMELEKEVGFARRHEQPLSLLMLDVDHFKTINDTFGHVAGDRVLRAISAQIRDLKRKEDAFARYGGEEFVILLRSTGAEGAYLLAERVRCAVEQLRVPHGNQVIGCTVSIGVATFGERADKAESLIELADRRLYQAKSAGRNRTEMSYFSETSALDATIPPRD
ncbi:MAG: diguanylate cyclase [Myxococcales bacterium]|nr:diguanylate cyclase [Myxococcales bacterium]